jgi:hypothetical protein
MIRKSDAVSIFRATRGSRSIEISVPGSFTAVRFLRPKKKPGASAADRGRPSLFKTIDEDQRERHDHINRSGRSTYPERISVLTSGATPMAESLTSLFARAPSAVTSNGNSLTMTLFANDALLRLREISTELIQQSTKCWFRAQYLRSNIAERTSCAT